MEILRKTTGIDTRAKGSLLKGRVKLELRDALTGKLKERVLGENMQTNALDSLINKVPFGLNQRNFSPVSAADMPLQSPLYNTALGGVILFPEELGADPDLLFPDMVSNPPTGYASCATYPLTDERQGIKIAGTQPISNGYRYKYSWGSLYGNVNNGKISAVALSHINCYQYFKAETAILGSLESVRIASNVNGCALGVNSKGLFFVEDGNMTSGSIKYASIPAFNIGLTDDTSNPEIKTLGAFTFDNTYGIETLVAVTETAVVLFRVGTGSPRRVDITYIAMDGTVTTSYFNTNEDVVGNSIYIYDYSGAAQHKCAYDGTYVWLPKSGYGSLIKIEIANPANATEISLGGINCKGGSSFVNGKVYVVSDVKVGDYGKAIIDDNDTLALVVRSDDESARGCWFPNYSNGVWICGGVKTGVDNVSILNQVMTPYCASHYDLGTVVNKDASKELVLTYEVTQV